MTIPIGKFQIRKTKRGYIFKVKGSKYMIADRKNPKGKPKKYLFNITEQEYISSLFPVSDNSYRFDNRIKNYLLELNEQEITITDMNIPIKHFTKKANNVYEIRKLQKVHSLMYNNKRMLTNLLTIREKSLHRNR